jgi:hypothetical protein
MSLDAKVTNKLENSNGDNFNSVNRNLIQLSEGGVSSIALKLSIRGIS